MPAGRYGALWLIVFISCPIVRVVFDVFRNAVHFVLITNNSVVITGLLGKRNVILVGESGYSRFKTTNHHRQGTLLW